MKNEAVEITLTEGAVVRVLLGGTEARTARAHVESRHVVTLGVRVAQVGGVNGIALVHVELAVLAMESSSARAPARGDATSSVLARLVAHSCSHREKTKRSFISKALGTSGPDAIEQHKKAFDYVRS